MTTDDSNRNPLFFVVPIACFGILAFAYVVYALEGWFHQDDFIFIAEFSRGLHLSDLVSFDGFGRFLTRNVYWYLGLDVFGRTSEFFYFLNFVTIVASTVVLYSFGRRFLAPASAIVVAAFYFGSPRVVHGYAWISNSQHLVAHLLCFVFLALLLDPRKPDIGARRSACLFAVLVLALISNSFALGLLAPLLWQLTDKGLRSSTAYRLLVLGSVAAGAFVFVRSANSATGAYEVDISFDALRSNAEAYWGTLPRFLLWIVGSLIAAFVSAWRGRQVESTMFVCSIAFYAPFAFLAQQRFPQYGVMSLVFLLIGSWMVVSRFVSSRFVTSRFGLSRIRAAEAIVAASVIAFVSVQGVQEFSARLADPLGSRARSLVESLRADSRTMDPSISTICFESAPVLDADGNETSLTPAVWWWVGHGLAFSLFVDASKTYELADDAADCDRTYFISPDSMYSVG